jgi:long-chain fatty acid transport protein
MDGLVAGFGVYNPYGLGSEWPEDWKGADKSIKVDLQSFFFTPTVAYKVSDEFSIGIGVNIVTGSVMIKKATAIPIGTDQERPILTVDLSATGLGFNFGALYKLAPEFSIGASYRSSVKLDASGTAKFNPNYAVLELPQGDASSSITLPATGYVGAAFKPMENLEIEADYQFVSWSSYDSLKLEFKADPTKNSATPKMYKDTYVLRLGAEYTMDALQLRAGYLYDHAPVDDIYIDPMLPDANRDGVNVGLGYKISEQIRVDVSYLFIKFKQKTVKNTIAGIDGTYNATANLIGIDIGYTF